MSNENKCRCGDTEAVHGTKRDAAGIVVADAACKAYKCDCGKFEDSDVMPFDRKFDAIFENIALTVDVGVLTDDDPAKLNLLKGLCRASYMKGTANGMGVGSLIAGMKI